ncbi:hypothetical protein HUJ04_011155 [Dendroctonus ponderosae]|nr:hypothetical protein HUJ04_011155 [Dendroctonus ponderosae]
MESVTGDLMPYREGKSCLQPPEKDPITLVLRCYAFSTLLYGVEVCTLAETTSRRQKPSKCSATAGCSEFHASGRKQHRIPVWVGKKLFTRYRTANRHKRNAAIVGGVIASEENQMFTITCFVVTTTFTAAFVKLVACICRFRIKSREVLNNQIKRFKN